MAEYNPEDMGLTDNEDVSVSTPAILEARDDVKKLASSIKKSVSDWQRNYGNIRKEFLAQIIVDYVDGDFDQIDVVIEKHAVYTHRLVKDSFVEE